MTMKKIDYRTINPGVRKLVKYLREAGVNTTDSGDGITNVKAGMEGALTVPHVHCVVEDNAKFFEELHFVGILLAKVGIELTEGMIQGTVDPMSKIWTISVFGIDDSMLDL
jgi:hypothetical protein